MALELTSWDVASLLPKLYRPILLGEKISDMLLWRTRDGSCMTKSLTVLVYSYHEKYLMTFSISVLIRISRFV